MNWKAIARDYGDPVIHGCAYCAASVSGMNSIVGRSNTSWAMEFNEKQLTIGAEWKWCGELEDFIDLGREVLRKLEDPAFFDFVDREGRRTIRELVSASAFLRDAPLASYSDEELAAAYESVYAVWFKSCAFGHVANLADFEHFMLTNKIMGFLEKRIAENGSENGRTSKISLPEAFAALTTPTEKNPLAIQEESFYSILALIQASPLAVEIFTETASATEIARKVEALPEIDRAVHAHSREFDWIQYHYSGPTILDETYFLDALASEVRQGTSGKQKLAEAAEKQRETRERQEAVAKELRLTPQEIYWTHVARGFMFLKALRKDVVFQASRNTDALLREVARRLGLTVLQAHYLAPHEAWKSLRRGHGSNGSGGASVVSPAELDARLKHSVWVFEGKTVRVYSGADAARLAQQIVEDKAPEDAASVRELKGTPASPGSARGTVRIIEKAEDMQKMRDGDILVSPATNPNLVPAMKLAAAIVTNEGGVTCHAAIVSRELGVPCVTGTRIATKILKDGDVVEVDANKGLVKKVG